MSHMKSWGTISIMLGLAALPAFGQQTQPASSQTQPASPATSAPAFDPSKSDEKAIAIADKVFAAMGGQAWAKTRFLKFSFVVKRGEAPPVQRTHYWDKAAQRSRMEGPSKDGKPVIAIVDHTTKQGQATLDGQLLFDTDAKKFIDLAHRNLINDSYWLFMQFKLKDPGTRLRYEGELKAGPITYDKILLSFDDGIGLTSKDKYWLYVNRATSTIERWSYVLTDSPAGTTPMAWEWTDWQETGGMKLAMKKAQAGGEVEILLENVQAFDTLPDTVFTSTATVDLTAAPAAGQ